MVTGALFQTYRPVRFSAVSGRSYTCKYRTVFSPSFLVRPVTPIGAGGSVDVLSRVHMRMDALPVHVDAVRKRGFVFSVALGRTAIVRVVAEQVAAVFVGTQRHALLDDITRVRYTFVASLR